MTTLPKNPLLPERYSIRDLVGLGGMGAVFRAFDHDLGADVAVKVLRADLQEDYGAFFQAEIRAAAELCHPYILPVYDAGLGGQTPFLSMKYVQGGSLASRVKDPPRWPEVAGIFARMLEALSFAHARGVLHRDLKPENILLGEESGAFLADLGLAVSLDQLERDRTRALEIYGTPPYMAPEQFSQDPRDLGPWTDLYAVGVMLFEIVGGARPFSGNPRALFHQKQNPPGCVMRPGYDAPRGLLGIIDRLLAPHPGERYELAADLLADLSALDQRSAKGGRRGAALSSAPPEDPRSEEAARASLVLFPMRDPGLVGRAAEKDLLWEKAREVVATGRPRLVLLEGEAGVGKSRLLRWLRENLEQRGVSRRILVREEDPRLGSLVGLSGAAHRMLRTYNLPAEEVRDRALAYLGVGPVREAEASALASWLSPAEGAEPLSSAERDLVFSPLLYREGRRGLVLVNWENIPRAAATAGLLTIERVLDLAKSTSLRAGEPLALEGAPEPLPVLFLATARPEDWQGSPGEAIRERLLLREEVTVLPVGRLSSEEQVRLVEERAPVARDLALLLAKRSEGNPLYAVELLKYWIAGEYLAPAERGFYRLRAGADPGAAMPRSLKLLCLERVAASIRRAHEPLLIEDALALAALLGREPSQDALFGALAMRWTAGAAQEGIEILRNEGFFRATERAGVFRFDHALLQELLAERAEARKDAAKLHRLCAEALETTRADAATVSAAAVHWEKGGEPSRAARGFLRAGERWQFTDFAQAEEAYKSAARLAATVEDLAGEAILAEARIGLGRIDCLQKRLPEARAHYTAALSSKDAVVRALALVGLAQIALQSRDLATARGQAEEARRLAMEEGERAPLAYSLQLLGAIYLSQSELDKATEYLTEAEREARAVRAQRQLANILRWLAKIAIQQGALERAKSHLEEAAQIASSLGTVILYATLQNDLGEIARHRGHLEEARQAYLTSQNLSQKLGYKPGVMLAEVNLAFTALLASNFTQAQQHLERVGALLPPGPHWLRALLALLHAWAASLSGAPEEAARLLEESLSLSIEKDVDSDSALAAERLGDSALGALAHKAYSLALGHWSKLGRTGDAARVAAKLEPTT